MRFYDKFDVGEDGGEGEITPVFVVTTGGTLDDPLYKERLPRVALSPALVEKRANAGNADPNLEEGDLQGW